MGWSGVTDGALAGLHGSLVTGRIRIADADRRSRQMRVVTLLAALAAVLALSGNAAAADRSTLHVQSRTTARCSSTAAATCSTRSRTTARTRAAVTAPAPRPGLRTS